MGQYPIFGGGLSALNYDFVQAAGNAVACTVTPSLPARPSLPDGLGTLGVGPEITRDVASSETWVYGRNARIADACAVTGPPVQGPTATGGGELIDVEWTRVRVKPNITTCLGLAGRNSCSDF